MNPHSFSQFEYGLCYFQRAFILVDVIWSQEGAFAEAISNAKGPY